MLVIHWTKQNKTASILKNGIVPQSTKFTYRRWRFTVPVPKGVYVYPYTQNRSARGRWRRVLKKAYRWRGGNYNGFVFRLVEEDFPVLAGDSTEVHYDPAGHVVTSMEELARKYGWLFKPGAVRDKELAEWFEIIIPRAIAPSRILRVIRDRQPLAKKRRAISEDQ